MCVGIFLLREPCAHWTSKHTHDILANPSYIQQSAAISTSSSYGACRLIALRTPLFALSPAFLHTTIHCNSRHSHPSNGTSRLIALRAPLFVLSSALLTYHNPLQSVPFSPIIWHVQPHRPPLPSFCAVYCFGYTPQSAVISTSFILRLVRADSSPSVPLIFVLSPGVDPTDNLRKLAQVNGHTDLDTHSRTSVLQRYIIYASWPR
jgi:hypothetical protein